MVDEAVYAAALKQLAAYAVQYERSKAVIDTGLRLSAGAQASDDVWTQQLRRAPAGPRVLLLTSFAHRLNCFPRKSQEAN